MKKIKLIPLILSFVLLFTNSSLAMNLNKDVEVKNADIEVLQTTINELDSTMDAQLQDDMGTITPLSDSFYVERRCKFSTRIPVRINGVETPAYIEPNFFATVSQDRFGNVNVKDFNAADPNYFATTPEQSIIRENNLTTSKRNIRYYLAWSGNAGRQEITQVTTIANAQKISASGQIEFKGAILGGSGKALTAAELAASRDYTQTVTFKYVLESTYRDNAEVEFIINGINDATVKITR